MPSRGPSAGRRRALRRASRRAWRACSRPAAGRRFPGWWRRPLCCCRACRPSGGAMSAEAALNERFLLDYPREAARELESMPPEEAAAFLTTVAPRAAVRAWQALAPDIARAALEHLPEPLAAQLLMEAEPAASVAALAQLDAEERARRLAQLDPQVARELAALVAYPEDAAGRMMDPRVSPLRAGSSVAEALARLRAIPRRGLRELIVVDDQGR